MTVDDLQLYKENNKYYISAHFFYEDKKGFYEVSIPKIRLPVSSDICIDIVSSDGISDISIDFGFGKLKAEPYDDQNHYYTLTCLEEKVHEMTLDEIERALGYKIKLKENTI